LLLTIRGAFVNDPEVTSYDFEPVEEGIKNFLKFLPEYCRRCNLNLYAVFDQHNGLSVTQRTAFPFNLVESVLPSLTAWKSALVVISASANNEYHLKVASDNHWPQFIINNGYSEEEWKAWIQRNLFFEKENLSQVEHWTQLIPYELQSLLNAQTDLKKESSTAPTLDQVLQQYLKSRRLQMSAQQRIFGEKLPESGSDRNRPLEAVVCMDLNLKPSSGDLTYLNQQLMYFDKDQYVHPITPLARDVLISWWDVGFYSELEKTVELIFKAPIMVQTADTKGRVLEKYVNSRLEESRSLDLDIFEIDVAQDITKWKKSHISFKNLIPIRFSGIKVPTQKDWTNSLLFIPEAPNYPDIDTLIWDPKQKLMVAIQITVHNPVSGHGNRFSEMRSVSQHDSQWKYNAWKDKSADIEMKFLWIASNSLVDSNMNQQYFASVQSLESWCPLVKHLRLD